MSNPPAEPFRSPPPPAEPPREGRDPALWPADVLAALQAVLDRSLQSGGAAVLDTFDHADRRLSAAPFVNWWNETRLKAMATVGPAGAPHLAPVHAEFVDGRLRSTIYEHAVRRRDLRANPEVAFTTWGDHGAAAIVYGRAREVPDSGRETRPGATGRARRTVTLDIEVTRIYAMKPRA
ncbi:MAG: pyridoxamine 5'-phosphate oxidase family protein [Candidatus Binatia bacterium]